MAKKNYLVMFSTDIEVEAEDPQEAYDIAADLFNTGGFYSDVEVEEI